MRPPCPCRLPGRGAPAPSTRSRSSLPQAEPECQRSCSSSSHLQTRGRRYTRPEGELGKEHPSPARLRNPRVPLQSVEAEKESATWCQ